MKSCKYLFLKELISQTLFSATGIPPKDLRDALRQYVLYHDILRLTEPDRILYLAIRKAVLMGVFEEPVGKLLLENQRVRLVVFDHRTEEILQWIP